MTLGEKIKQLRKNRGLAQHELGAKLGVKQNTIHHWEIGRNDPTIFNCVAIADYFGITLDELLGRTRK